MNREEWIERLLKPASAGLVAACGVLLLVIVYGIPWQLEKIQQQERRLHRGIQQRIDETAIIRDRLTSSDTLKTLDLEQLKVGISNNALSQKSLFESGLSLQEERRLLEKQLEIITTHFLINPALQRVFLMRAEQVLQSYYISYIPLKSFNGATVTLPKTVRIVSKERFAHPERGKSEAVDGTLQWVPPQVGSSVRSNALGEFVIFTNSALILHGPPVNPLDHEKFPHVCLGLDKEAARRLYRGSFIGTKIELSQVTIEAAAPSPPPELEATQ